MSLIPSGLIRHLQFYLSGVQPCPYLPDQVERKLFARLQNKPESNDEINSHLTRGGFRRSHDIAYRPACPRCHACIPVRLPVRLFAPSASLRRIMRRNADLRLERAAPRVSDENYQLFCAYQNVRHPDSEMAEMSELDFRALIQETTVTTVLYQLRAPDDRLVGCMLTDVVADGFSAVYSFFAPAEHRRSLGIQLILSLAQEAERLGYPYIYLGYWIAEARKMSYKSRFKPLQALTAQGWGWLE